MSYMLIIPMASEGLLNPTLFNCAACNKETQIIQQLYPYKRITRALVYLEDSLKEKSFNKREK